MNEMQLNLDYTTHHNWDWVLNEATQSIYAEEITTKTKLARFKDLPSQVDDKTKAKYSLFRIDLSISKPNEPNTKTIGQVRATSESFAFLDPKDALYKEMVSCDVEQCMPRTTLIEWDNNSEIAHTAFPSCPALLKASLGSGGFGLYFVYTSNDILEVMKAHRRRAERAEGFLDGLRRDYGHVPHWSLQQLIPSVRVAAMNNRRCQIRAYVVECNGQLYLYDTYEVRVPGWDIDLDAVLADELARSRLEVIVSPNDSVTSPALPRWSEEVENECCGAGNARPYNEQRNKSVTERYLIGEIDELSNPAVREAIHHTLLTGLQGIKHSVLSRCKQVAVTTQTSSSGNSMHILPSTMAVAGIDLLVSCNEDGSYSAHIVEINNNPAMPAPHKHMSPLYRAHLVTMVAEILQLGLRVAVSDYKKTSHVNNVMGVDFLNKLFVAENVVGEKFEII